eukprot:TRINITY_DN9159_c0_g3_i1.p1 TRINITY_DN9159_c0_g3~~TRINITY_DN9159_c0_g3_i1.p1  ORF type:complete len:345 (-),score=56.83 TRINITY_DN9159_c0_g3_i1:46-1080(-)
MSRSPKRIQDGTMHVRFIGETERARNPIRERRQRTEHKLAKAMANEVLKEEHLETFFRTKYAEVSDYIGDRVLNELVTRPPPTEEPSRSRPRDPGAPQSTFTAKLAEELGVPLNPESSSRMNVEMTSHMRKMMQTNLEVLEEMRIEERELRLRELEATKVQQNKEMFDFLLLEKDRFKTSRVTQRHQKANSTTSSLFMPNRTSRVGSSRMETVASIGVPSTAKSRPLRGTFAPRLRKTDSVLTTANLTEPTAVLDERTKSLVEKLIILNNQTMNEMSSRLIGSRLDPRKSTPLRDREFERTQRLLSEANEAWRIKSVPEVEDPADTPNMFRGSLPRVSRAPSWK